MKADTWEKLPVVDLICLLVTAITLILTRIQARGNVTYATSEFKVYEEPEYTQKYLSRVGWPLSQQRGYIAERLFGDDAEVANSPAWI